MQALISNSISVSIGISPLSRLQSSTETSTTTIPLHHSQPNISPPMDFTRDCQFGQTFLSACCLYIQLCIDQFLCDQNKILWMLSFFRSSRVTKWLEGLFREESSTKSFPIIFWLDFEQVFKNQFFLVNTATKVMNKLEGVSY